MYKFRCVVGFDHRVYINLCRIQPLDLLNLLILQKFIHDLLEDLLVLGFVKVEEGG